MAAYFKDRGLSMVIAEENITALLRGSRREIIFLFLTEEESMILFTTGKNRSGNLFSEMHSTYSYLLKKY